jgi:hypothetical protein
MFTLALSIPLGIAIFHIFKRISIHLRKGKGKSPYPFREPSYSANQSGPLILNNPKRLLSNKRHVLKYLLSE